MRRPRLGTIAGVYLLLLACSHVVRGVRSPDRLPPASVPTLELRAVEGERLLEQRIRLAYDDLRPEAGTPRTTLLLLHGSPGSRRDFSTLGPALARNFRLLAPDLPGFGDSQRRVPDYSSRAHARYALQLLDALEVERVHLVGFSMGGAVALQLYDLAPQRVRSVTMLSAIGVQELELFGSHRMNHLVHAAQLGALWLLREATPHLGLLDRAFLGVPYARNFYDSDQRPLRPILERYRAPMLILHGRRDFLVPPEAAREHMRIVPQSELQMLEASHFMVFRGGAELARHIAEFVERVEAGVAPEREAANIERRRAAARPFDPAALPPFRGVALILMTTLIAVATLVSEDLTCIGVGLLAAQGRIGFWPGVLACAVGIYFGDLLLFLAGRWLGRGALRRAPLRWMVPARKVELASAWLSRRGPVVILLSRFAPGARLPTYFASGVLRTPFRSFALYFLLAVALWTPLVVGFSMIVGERALEAFELVRRGALWALLFLALLLLAWFKLAVPLLSYRGRRRWVGRLRRTRRWEFWPPWLFYPPVVAGVIGLGLKHRSPLLFTAANPAIVAAGFIGESKHRILGGLAGSPEFVARTLLLPVEQNLACRTASVASFLERHALSYPVVLKPDAGQRGAGVAIVDGEDRLRSYLERAPFPALVQEYVPGRELGIFYYRYPREPCGRVFSITDKRLPVLRGDGRRTVEELILGDDRAVCMADHYLRVNAARLDRVPAVGEAVPLVELGTHCRGAIFLDGSRFRTEELERAIDRISRGFDGFYFGRYDVRTADLERLMAGRDFKIIELNGVTSEATHIYDPAVGLLEAYRTLFEQWRVAYEIGRQNREAGARTTGVRELIRLWRGYRETARDYPG